MHLGCGSVTSEKGLALRAGLIGLSREAGALAVRDALSFGEGLSCGRSRSATNGQLRAGTDQGNPRAAHLRHSRSGRHIGRLAIASAGLLRSVSRESG